MSNVLERIQETLDPTSAANALHEVMLLWKEADDSLSNYIPRGAGRYQIVQGSRDAYERVLAIFLGVGRNKVRQIMREHYKETRHGQS
jgi:hypothetical protein